MSATIGEVLIKEQLLTAEQVETVMDYKSENRMHFGEACIKLGFIDKEQLFHALGLQMHLPNVDLNYFSADTDAIMLVDSESAHNLKILPLYTFDDELAIATADPLNVTIIDTVIRMTGKKVQLALATESQIMNAIQTYYSGLQQEAVEEEEEEGEEEELTEEETHLVIGIADEILRDAVRTGVSDIHIEHYEDNVLVRFRIDGVLQKFKTYSRSVALALVSRFKVMSNIDIAESRKPQDGRFEYKVSKRHKLDFRVSTFPSVFGEKIVMRLLDPAKGNIALDKLGFSNKTITQWKNTCKSPNGIILVTGPTGSGKSTTLFATLNLVSSVSKHLITIEDPIEYKFKNIVQAQVNDRAGMTFANALRAMMRQDPDIIMVGEMRDRETIELAIRAALTGHLVFSTLHTNDAAASYSRLFDMGTDAFLLSSTVRAILAQRLIRVLCSKCKVEYTPSEAELLSVGLETIDRPIYKTSTGGCRQCRQTGYKGRSGLYELLIPSPEIKDLVKDSKSDIEIKKLAVEQGMSVLEEEGHQFLLDGKTTIEELVRVL